MREHLFRAIDKYNGGWVYGSLIELPDGKTYILSRQSIQPVEVGKETVGKFTGYTLNGCNVYEGDIIRAEFDDEYSYATVVFKDGAYMFEEEVNGKLETQCYVHDTLPHFAEIVGNVHEPLEVKK